MNNTQQTHDAQQILSSLRDHLARHDKPIAFFLGAGTSCAIRVAVPDDKDKTQPLIPAVAELTKICREEARGLGKKYEETWQLIEEHYKVLPPSSVATRLRAVVQVRKRAGCAPQ